MAKVKRLTAGARRAQLIATGRAVFAKRGYNATTVEEIARAAGVSKPIVYEHFGGKEGLYAVVVDREMEALHSRMIKVISSGTPRHRYEQAVLALLTYVQDQPDGFALLTRDAPMYAGGQGMPAVINELGVRVGDIFREQFTRAGLDARVAPIYAHSLIGMVVLAGQWWSDQQEFSKEEVASHVAAIGWMGLRHLPAKIEPLISPSQDTKNNSNS
ncbi:MAG: TetR/AcrR family transcriptional regulator [Kofleriaceae bacterium]|nr:TetR/AcrR family transcriptional regulator [Kofleriaceae bacterium]